jgi:hypothetical protein
MRYEMKDSRVAKSLCVNCQEHRALYRRRGGVRRGRGFNLCFRCYRSLVDSYRLRPLMFAEAVSAVELPLAA